MNAIVVHKPGGAEVLQIERVPDPSCGPDQVIIRNEYVGVNFGDVIRRKRGWTGPTSPFIPGFEGVGVVHAVGRAVTTPKLGDLVGYLVRQGAQAELTAVPAAHTFAIPDDLPASLVAATICVGTTAWSLLELSESPPRKSVLVHGAAGGVGAAVLQLAKARGVRTMAVVGGPEKAAYAEICGASVVIRHEVDDFVDRILHETDGAGVDVVFDCVGQAVAEGNTRALKPGGIWLYYGSTSGHAAFPGEAVLNQRLTIKGFVIFGILNEPTEWKEAVAPVIQALRNGMLAPKIEIFPADEIRRVHTRLEERSLIGKAVLDLREFGQDGI